MNKQEKSIYDKTHYKENKKYRNSKLARMRALILLSHKYPREFKKLLKKEQEK